MATTINMTTDVARQAYWADWNQLLNKVDTITNIQTGDTNGTIKFTRENAANDISVTVKGISNCAFIATGSDTTKFLRNDGSWQVPSYYQHPTSDGNKHVPATGTTSNGKVLIAGSTAGSFSWKSLADAGIATSGHNHTGTYVRITGDTMTGGLVVRKSDGESPITVADGTHYTDNTFRMVMTLNPTNGTHGLWSSGFMNNSTFTGTTKWICYRDSAGDVYLNGQANRLPDRTLTIGSTGKTFNGTANVSWTLAEIGAAAASHGTHVSYGTSTAKIGTASAGSATTVSRSDHVHAIDLATGDSNGQVKIAGSNVSVKGLAALAYKASVAWSEVTSRPSNAGSATRPVYWSSYAATQCDFSISTYNSNTQLWGTRYYGTQGTGSTTTYTSTALIVSTTGLFLYGWGNSNGTLWSWQKNDSGQWSGDITGSSGSCRGNAATASAVAWGNVTSRPSNAGSGSRPVYWSSNAAVQCDTPVSGAWYKGVPYVGSNGVMEIGRYIDFHNGDTSTNDYDVRLNCTGNGALTITGTTTGTFSGSLSGNATSATKATQDGSGNTITSYYVTLSTTQTISGAKTFSNHVYISAAKHLYMVYNSTNYYVLHNHNNGNVSLNACGVGLYIGYFNTTLINWINGKMTLSSAGALATASSITAGGTISANYSAAMISAIDTANHNLQVSLHVGSGHQNHGIYSYGYAPSGSTYTSGGGWIIYRDAAGNAHSSLKIYDAVWNDFAEFREGEITKGGYSVYDDGKGYMRICTERMQPGSRLTSDTFGVSVGYSKTARTPIGVGGRVLARPYQERNNYKVGDALCSAPNGTVDIMTREEIMMYPDRIIGIVSEIPDYDMWDIEYGAEEEDKQHTNIKIDGRIWVYVK